MTRSPPSRSMETRRPAWAARSRSSPASSTDSGSEALGKACLLERVGPVRARDLAAQLRPPLAAAVAVPPGERPARLHADVEDCGRELLRPLDIPLVTAVVEHE